MDRFEQTKKAGLYGIIGNIFLLIIKGTVGFIFRSQAMIADAANSAGDIFASLLLEIKLQVHLRMIITILVMEKQNIYFLCLLQFQ